MTAHAICHLDRYAAAVSSLTGRTVFVNQAPRQYLVSPEVHAPAVARVAERWLERVEAPLHVSKVAHVTADGKATRVRFEERDGKKVRVAVKTGDVING